MSPAYVITKPDGSCEQFIGTAHQAVNYAGRFVQVDRTSFHRHVEALEHGECAEIDNGFTSCCIEPE